MHHFSIKNDFRLCFPKKDHAFMKFIQVFMHNLFIHGFYYYEDLKEVWICISLEKRQV